MQNVKKNDDENEILMICHLLETYLSTSDSSP